jgi:hypothetical protein
VYLPDVELDEAAVRTEIQRIISLGVRSMEDRQMLECMNFALHAKYVRDFCVFTGKAGSAGIFEQGSKELTMQLEELVFGPPPPGFFPSPTLGFNKGLAGKHGTDFRAQVNAPAWLTYPANALVFAAQNGLPVINDNPNLPVPGLGSADPKTNAKLLATILTIESVRMALPKLRGLNPKELSEFRQQISQYVQPFRLAMLKLAKDLNAAIKSDAKLEDVQKEARFLVETTVFPQLKELEKVMHDPGKPWYRRAVDLAISAPELASSFLTMPTNLAIAKLLAKVAGTLADLRDEQRDKEHQLGRGGLHYLLKLQDKSK